MGKFYANMQWSRRKSKTYCLIDGTKFVLTPTLIEKVYLLPDNGVKFFGSSFDLVGMWMRQENSCLAKGMAIYRMNI